MGDVLRNDLSNRRPVVIEPEVLDASTTAEARTGPPSREPALGNSAGRVSIDRERLSDVLGALARKHQVPGAQLAISYRGETTALEVGELEYGTGRLVTQDAAFPVGSISKSFTATLAMALVADGDVELDAPLAEYVPELEGCGFQLTLRQVLSHTSGLASSPDSEQVANVSRRRYLLDHCRRRNLVQPPGIGFSYSNIGYVVAGHLIETLTGMSWWVAMESILLRPLGIDAVFINGPRREPPGRPVAAGHSVNTVVGRTRPVRQSLAPAEAPAGALAVSAVDLVSLGLIHVGSGMPELLPESYAEEMRKPVPGAIPFGLADAWGLGLAAFREGPADWVGHDGNADGTSCYLRINPADGWIIAFTSNANTGMGMWQDLLGELARALIPIDGPRGWASHGRPITPSRSWTGRYVNGGAEYEVARGEDGHLYLAMDGEAAVLTCFEDSAFALRDPKSGQQVIGGRFVRDPRTGKVDGIQVGGRLARRQVRTSREAA